MSTIGKNGKRANAKYTTHDVAKVMLYTFKPAPPAGYTCVEHIDGDKFNDHIDNLRWTTRCLLLKKSLSTKCGRPSESPSLPGSCRSRS